MLKYLQVMIFNNLFVLGKQHENVKRVQDLVERLLKDDRLEVSLYMTNGKGDEWGRGGRGGRWC